MECSAPLPSLQRSRNRRLGARTSPKKIPFKETESRSPDFYIEYLIMDKSLGETPENAIEAWTSHLALSSGSDRSDTASSRGSSSVDAASLYRRQPFGKRELCTTMTDEHAHQEYLARNNSDEEDDDDDGDEEKEADDDDDDEEEEEEDDDDDEEDEGDSDSEAESAEAKRSLRDRDEPIHQEEDQDSEPTPTDILSATVDIFSTAFSTSDSPSASPNSQAEAMVQLLHLQHQDEHLHSPRPQRKYRATVTSAYEPTPLPLYDHTQLLLPAPYMHRFPQVGAPWQPHVSVPHAAHAAYAAHAPMMYPAAHAGFQYPEAPEPTAPAPAPMPAPSQEALPSQSRQRRKLAGYELIASKLSQPAENGDGAAVKRDAATCKGPLPLYRRFEELNHRILLHLQDEISALETDLHAVDDEIMEMSAVVSSAARAFPQGPSASTSGHSPLVEELKYRRTELLGRVFIKLGQYNQAMEAHTTSAQRLRAADSREIASYQSWLRQNGETEESDGRFLDHGPDLVSLPRPVRSVSEASRKAVGGFVGTFLTIVIVGLVAFSIGGRGSRA